MCLLACNHFWLTHGLAFAPRHGSALYIDVRLVTHCSDPCIVTDKKHDLEGCCGEEQPPQQKLARVPVTGGS